MKNGVSIVIFLEKILRAQRELAELFLGLRLDLSDPLLGDSQFPAASLEHQLISAADPIATRIRRSRSSSRPSIPCTASRLWR